MLTIHRERRYYGDTGDTNTAEVWLDGVPVGRAIKLPGEDYPPRTFHAVRYSLGREGWDQSIGFVHSLAGAVRLITRK